MIVWVNVVLNRTVVDSDVWTTRAVVTDVIQLTLTLQMTTALVVETSVTVNNRTIILHLYL